MLDKKVVSFFLKIRKYINIYLIKYIIFLENDKQEKSYKKKFVLFFVNNILINNNIYMKYINFLWLYIF